MKTLLLVDDDRLPMDYYVRALERRGFNVVRCLEADSLDKILGNMGADFVGVILDIMMLPGNAYKDKDTQEGLSTGYFIYQDIRRRYPDIPIFVLTNVSNIETLQKFQGVSKLKVLQKLDFPPFEFADHVLAFIEGKNQLTQS